MVEPYGECEYALNLFYLAELRSRRLQPHGEIGAFGWFDLNDLPRISSRNTRRFLGAHRHPARGST